MWSNSNRRPDSREEDAWLSDEQMKHVAPAEDEPFQSPVPTRMVSNGEYMPHPQTEQEKWHYPALTEMDKRNIFGLNSARLYGLHGRQAVPVGEPGSAYKTGSLPSYASFMQPGSAIDTALQGAGYPTPITPVSLIPNDNITKVKADYLTSGAGRTITRHGWIRTS